MAEKLRQLRVRSSEEAQREEKQRKSSTKSLPRLLKSTLRSFAEILKTEKTPLGGGVCVKVGEEKSEQGWTSWIDVWLGGGVKGLLRSRRSTL